MHKHMADLPDIPEAEADAHEAQVDAFLADTLVDGDDFDSLAEPEPVDVDYEEVEAGEAGAADSDTPSHTEDDYHTAWQALRRDGWSAESINAMDRSVLVRQGLERAERQREVDAAFSERAQLRRQLGLDSTEAPEGPDESGDSGYARESSDSSVGADLALEARPVAERIAELDDPEQIAQALAGFVAKAIQSQMHQVTELSQLESRAQELADGRYEGDISTLMNEAKLLGGAGRHANLTGMARYDALIEDALRLQGAGTQTNSTNRAEKKRGARPPIPSKRSTGKPRSADESVDARLRAIFAGERDVGKLRQL